MSLIRVCDHCQKVIKDDRYVQAGVCWRPQSFHLRCAPAVVEFLKAVHAPGIEELLTPSEKLRVER